MSDLAPGAVILNTVDGQGDHLHTSFLELCAEFSGPGELGGADRSEVPRVRKQDAPTTEENTKIPKGSALQATMGMFCSFFADTFDM